jgi:hypothetical protein
MFMARMDNIESKTVHVIYRLMNLLLNNPNIACHTIFMGIKNYRQQLMKLIWYLVYLKPIRPI